MPCGTMTIYRNRHLIPMFFGTPCTYKNNPWNYHHASCTKIWTILGKIGAEKIRSVEQELTAYAAWYGARWLQNNLSRWYGKQLTEIYLVHFLASLYIHTYNEVRPWSFSLQRQHFFTPEKLFLRRVKLRVSD